MFSLIITIISIALVAALALATLYYGGASFSRGKEGREAARLINEGPKAHGVRFEQAERAGWKAAQLLHAQRAQRFA